MKDRLQELRNIIQNANADLSQYVFFKQQSNCTMDNNGLSPLHVAISQNNIEKVKTMVENGANLEEKTSWSTTLYLTPLLLAAKKGCIEITKVLIKAGADMNTRDKHGLSPLHLAVKYAPLRKVEGIVNTLIRSGAEINDKCDEGWSPLHLAVEEHLLDIAELLLYNRANINATYLDKVSKIAVTPLLLAIEEEKYEMAKLLITKGADLYPNMEDNSSILHLVVKEDTNNEQLDFIRFLLKNGSNIEAITFNGHTPLHLATLQRNVEVAKLLIDQGADVNAINTYGSTSLHM